MLTGRLVRAEGRRRGELIKPMLTCRETTALVLQAEDRRLPLTARLAMRLHQRICRNCRRFNRQVELMRQASARWRQYTQD